MERLSREMPEQIAIHERCADFMAGPGGIAELAKTDPDYALWIQSTTIGWFATAGQ
jgi:hypothetical protein